MEIEWGPRGQIPGDRTGQRGPTRADERLGSWTGAVKLPLKRPTCRCPTHLRRIVLAHLSWRSIGRPNGSEFVLTCADIDALNRITDRRVAGRLVQEYGTGRPGNAKCR